MEKGFCEIEISKLVKAKWNYKTEDSFLTEKLIKNIKKNGQIENLIVRELNGDIFEVVNGNHRFDVLKILGFKTAKCYNLGKISTTQAKRIAIETNETKFQTNENLLGNLLSDILDEYQIDDILSTMPFSEKEIKKLTEQHPFFDNIPNLSEVIDEADSGPIKDIPNLVDKEIDKDTKYKFIAHLDKRTWQKIEMIKYNHSIDSNEYLMEFVVKLIE